MGLVYSGELSIGALCPLAVSGAAAAAGELTTQLGFLTSLTTSLGLSPPSFTANATAAAALIAALTLAVPVLPPFPSVSLMLAGNVTAIASLEAQIALLSPLMNLFDEAGVFVYAFDGRTTTLGPSVTNALATGFPGAAGARQNANAVLLATVTPATWTSLLAFLQGVPAPGPGAGLVYGGAATLGSLAPFVLRALGGVYADLKGRLAGLISMVAKFTATPPTVLIAISDVHAIAASLAAAISAGLPGAAFIFDAVAKAVTAIGVAAAVIVQLQALFGTAGVFVYKYDGATGQLGQAITSSVAGGWPDGTPASSRANAILLGATTPATWTALQAFFGGA